MLDVRNPLIVFGITATILMASGCDSSSVRMEVHPVRGRVVVKGKPAVNAQVSLFAVDDALKAPDAPFPRGTTTEDGYFELTSYTAGDGAPAGKYVVTVIWRARAGESDDPEINDSMPDQLRGRYSDPETSTLQVEVKAMENELPTLELK